MPNSVWQKERLRLNEEQRKRRQADVGHRIVPRALPLVGKGGAGVMQPGQEAVENQHPDLESESRAQENQKSQPRPLHLELLRVKAWRCRRECAPPSASGVATRRRTRIKLPFGSKSSATNQLARVDPSGSNRQGRPLPTARATEPDHSKAQMLAILYGGSRPIGAVEPRSLSGRRGAARSRQQSRDRPPYPSA